MPRLTRPWLVVIAALAAAPAVAQAVQFRHPQNDSPLELDLRPDQVLTAAVESFHATGDNPYRGHPQAVIEGKELFRQHCASCHDNDGAVRTGSNLADEIWTYSRTNTDVGRFEVIYAGYGGAAGEGHAFGRLLDQDDILELMAYLDALRSG